MPTPSEPQLSAALADLIQEMLTTNRELRAPGLGVFRVHHEPSQIERGEDGEVSLRPPRDLIAFMPER